MLCYGVLFVCCFVMFNQSISQWNKLERAARKIGPMMNTFNPLCLIMVVDVDARVYIQYSYVLYVLMLHENYSASSLSSHGPRKRETQKIWICMNIFIWYFYIFLLLCVHTFRPTNLSDKIHKRFNIYIYEFARILNLTQYFFEIAHHGLDHLKSRVALTVLLQFYQEWCLTHIYICTLFGIDTFIDWVRSTTSSIGVHDINTFTEKGMVQL
jgi:hypothetical protein